VRRNVSEHVELQAHLLQCGFCDSVSSLLVRGIRPAGGGRRTDLIVFGVCSDDSLVAQDWCAENGYLDAFCVEWAALPEVLADIEAMGFVP
jgi:hypothetical protein